MNNRLSAMRPAVLAGLPLLASTIISCSSSVGEAPAVSLLSSKPEYVSGDDALVKISVSSQNVQIQVTLNGTDVSESFKRSSATPTEFVGLVKGIRQGSNELTAVANNAITSITLTGHPISGPIFSGPQQQPFTCQTDTFRLPDGVSFLGVAKDAKCSADTRVDYVYRNTAATPQFVPLKSTTALPTDVATTTVNGKSVPYVVRVETGVINRAIYQISMIHNPIAEAAPTFASSPSGWNGKLVYTFGGGCTGGWYRQGNTTGGVLDNPILSQGYAMASSSLNVFGNNCQDLTAAESMAMVKERFIEAYGPPKYTIGWGCSGGSYQQHQIADNYPGLLDGILPGCSFPEVGFATTYSITDMRLLGNYFKNVAPNTFTDAQQEAVAGVKTVKTIYTGTVYDGAMRIAPNAYCPSTLPADQRYDPVKNPTGVRCSIYDHNVNVFGKDAVTGFALRPIDNVGVQYGLQALNAGVITIDQFLTLNEKVGGYDKDARFSKSRTVADLSAVTQAYQTGRLTSGGGGLKEIPIIDHRGYSDDRDVGDIHLKYHSFSMRERLIKANGNADNQVMLHEDFRYGYYSSFSPLLMDALKQMDLWLANISADTSASTKREKVIRNKPATLEEGCLTRDAVPKKIVEKLSQTAGKCAELYPAPGSPRFVAGAPISADVIKCQLKAPNTSEYKVTFTAAEWTRLNTVFKEGVCDWSKPGIEQQGLRGTWLKF
ncbi:MAG: hypothetical protein FJY26_10845 [Betaproteobacteria bacterium]|nr:hypothetical protein [Betaproteobacteria bacterium]